MTDSEAQGVGQNHGRRESHFCDPEHSGNHENFIKQIIAGKQMKGVAWKSRFKKLSD